MITTIRTAPPHSLFVISGSIAAPVPEITRTPVVWHNSFCVVVGCRSSQDGETILSLLSDGEKTPLAQPAFDGMIETPQKMVFVSTSERDRLGQIHVASMTTRVRVWINHPVEPDTIHIAMG
jgi:hypothetical protein